MAHNEDLAQAFVIPNDILQRALLEQPVTVPALSSLTEVNPALSPPVEQEGQSKLRSLVSKAAAGVALTGYLLFGGEQEAEAAPAAVEPVATQTSQEPNPLTQNIPHALTAIALVTTLVMGGKTLTRQGKEQRQNRFSAVLQAIVGESSGEDRILKLANLKEYASDKEYAAKVFEKVVPYLRGRRGSIEKIRRDHQKDIEQIRKDHQEDDAELDALIERCNAELDFVLTERLNADREALKLLLETMPAARKLLKRPSRIKRLMGADELHELDKDTETPISNDKPRVNARGINLDSMRGIKRCSFRDTDLTGAGMRECQLTSVIFRNARISEAKFEGSTLYRCSLRGTDAQAVYWNGATIEQCVIDKNTKLGNLPNDHPDAKHGILQPEKADEYRGMPKVILKDLVPKGMSEEQLIEQIHEWQRNGLELLTGSNPEYLLEPADGPNHSRTQL